MITIKNVSRPGTNVKMWEVKNDGVYVGIVTRHNYRRGELHPWKVLRPATGETEPNQLVAFVWPYKSNVVPDESDTPPTRLGDLQIAAEMLIEE